MHFPGQLAAMREAHYCTHYDYNTISSLTLPSGTTCVVREAMTVCTVPYIMYLLLIECQQLLLFHFSIL